MAVTVDTRNARRPGRAPSAVLARVSQRARAFAAAQRHSRLVALLRIVLPLGALATMAVYAAVVAIAVKRSGSHFNVDAISITADDLTMKHPSYFDFTKDGRYEVRAERAVVAFDRKSPTKLIDVSGDLIQTSGTVTKLKAKHGLFDDKKGELELFDGIEIDGTDGVMARLSRAMIYSKEGKVVSTDPVSATTPTGSVQAAAMTMYNKTRQVEFRGQVAVRLLPQQGQTLGLGKDARQPVDVRSEELDVDDAAKTAQFRGSVVAIQGDTMLEAPFLLVKYEGKAAAAVTSGTEAPAGKDASKDPSKEGTRLTSLSARTGIQITAGTDRRITSDSVDYDAIADSAVFAGSVVVTQDKNILKGGRLLVDRKAGRSHLETPGEGGRISARFYQSGSGAVPTRQPKRQPAVEAVQGAMLGSFKADRNAPMDVVADTLDLHDTANKAVFSGEVVASQGDLKMETAELTAFYSGQSGMGFTHPADDAAAKTRGQDKDKGQEKSEITRMEARHGVILTSKDQTATGKSADFNVKANTAVLYGGVTVTRATEDPTKMDVLRGERLRVDFTTGISQVEAETPAVPQPPRPPSGPPPAPATSASPVVTSGATPAEKVEACPPGRTCILIHPQKAMDALRKGTSSGDGR